MTKNENIEQEIERTLLCFDEAERLKADPFFYTRLQTRIKDLEERKGFSLQGLLNVKVLRPALLTLVIVMNIVTTFVVFQKVDRQTDYRDQYLTSFAEEYSLNQESNGYFRIE